ncbi:hypothetical protein Sros01_36170 [Streptomyces roseochromogenus]|nr:hypothetical protein Sros01_36170 [Streptomyces roseochromogenus]
MYQTIADNSRLGQQSLQPWQPAATELDSCFPLAYFTADTRLAAVKSPAGAHCASPVPATGPSSTSRSKRCARTWESTPEAGWGSSWGVRQAGLCCD